MAQETHKTISVEPRWLRNEDGEYRITVCVRPEDVAEIKQLVQRSGTQSPNVLLQLAISHTSSP